MAIYVVGRVVYIASPLFLTAFLGILFGLAVSSGVDYLTRFRLPRGLSAALIVLSFFGLFYGFGAWMAPTLHSQGIELRRRLPDAVDRVQAWIDRRRDGVIGIVFNSLSNEARVDSTAARADAAVATPPSTAASAPPAHAIAATKPDSNPRGDALKDRIGSKLGGASRYLFPFIHSTIEIITGLLIITFLSIYISVDPGMYRRGILLLIPPQRRARSGEVLTAIGAVLRRWLVTQLIAMITLGVITTIALLLLHVKAAFALGLLSGLFEFIPTIGPIISSLPAIAMGFLDSPEKAVWVTLVYVGVHFMESHLLIPLLMKGNMDLPPALTIVTQALMVLLFGLLGLMCAVPLLAASVVAVKLLYVEGDAPDTTIRPPGFRHLGAGA